MIVDKFFVLLLVGSGKIPTFAPVKATLKKMSVYLFGIPFRITCSGEAASQFYNPLQVRVASDKRARLDGITTAKLARNFYVDNHFYSNSIHSNVFPSKIRRGQGALMLPGMLICLGGINAPAAHAAPLLSKWERLVDTLYY